MNSTILFLGISIFSTVIAQLLLRKAMLQIGKMEFSLPNLANLFLQIFQNIYLFSGAVFFGIAFLAWLFVLSKKQLNIVYPISSSLILSMVAVGSFFIFKEQLTSLQILGIMLIIGGIFLLSFKTAL